MQTKLPLSEQLRPNNIKDVVGQKHLVGKDGFITKLIQKYEQTHFFPSIILWGPPGCGKTTIARLIAQEINRTFYEFSAVNSSTKDIEKVLNLPKNTKQRSLLDTNLDNLNSHSQAPVIFIDEIHRFNKAQQDALLPIVEQGKIILIGATTENPSFEVIGPLLSRTRVLVLKQLTTEDLIEIVGKAETITNTQMSEEDKKTLVELSNGDARTCINIFEISSHLANNGVIEKENIKEAMQRHNLSFDLKGEEFYNTISAFHKSVRGSDPDAALYWLTRMLEAGQDPLYIARRMIRMASEDIGLKDPQALVITTACFNACQYMGMPECNLALAQAAIYLAKSSKENKIYIAYQNAAKDVQEYGNLPVPMHIRNAPTDLMKDLGYGKDYDYSHSETGEKKPDINYMPDDLKDKKYL